MEWKLRGSQEAIFIVAEFMVIEKAEGYPQAK
jgi:hypothetical protein